MAAMLGCIPNGAAAAPAPAPGAADAPVEAAVPVGAVEAAAPGAAELAAEEFPHGFGIASETGPALVSTVGTEVSVRPGPVIESIALSIGAWMFEYIRESALKPPGIDSIFLRAWSLF